MGEAVGKTPDGETNICVWDRDGIAIMLAERHKEIRVYRIYGDPEIDNDGTIHFKALPSLDVHP